MSEDEVDEDDDEEEEEDGSASGWDARVRCTLKQGAGSKGSRKAIKEEAARRIEPHVDLASQLQKWAATLKDCEVRVHVFDVSWEERGSGTATRSSTTHTHT